MTAETMPPLLDGSAVRLARFSVVVRRRSLIVGIVLTLVLVALLVASLMIGTISVTPRELLDVFTGDARPSTERSVLGRRLPRALTGALVGACLAMSGAVFQSLSRNPLGSPDIIGFTTGAATGAVAQIVLFGGGVIETAAAAVAGGLITAVLVYVLARRDGSTGGLRLVLVGIGIGAVLSAVSSLLIVRADLDDATAAQLWTAGSLVARGWPHVLGVGIAAAVLLPAIIALGRSVSLLEMGDDAARAVGVRVERVRFGGVVLAVAAAAVAVAAAGPIAFVAFAAPHIARRLSPAPGVQLVSSALVGAALLVAADLLSQNLDVGLRTPVGLVTSVLGGVYLIWLLARRI